MGHTRIGLPAITGLGGFFDIKLQWIPDLTESGTLGPAPEVLPPAASGPSIFTALQEQLGLQLESAKGPDKVIVIDSIERPSEN